MRKGSWMNEEEKKDNSDRWLLTYSDMITLLLALFIILYGMSSLNISKFGDVSRELKKALNNTEGLPQAGADMSGDLNSVYTTLNDYVSTHDLDHLIDLSHTSDSVTIHLKDAMLFTPNTAYLMPESAPVMQEITDTIRSVYDHVDHITITGNTADLGHRDTANEADSWQLSVDRAVCVLKAMTDMGLAPDKMSIEGNSHYKPIAPNNSESGRARNRRVEITIKSYEGQTTMKGVG